MLTQVESTQILSSLTITNSTKAKKNVFLSHVTINKQITPKGSRERQGTKSYAPRGGLLKRGRGPDQLSDISDYSSAFFLHSSSTFLH